MMKKILLCIAVAMVIIGCGMGAAGMSKLNWDFKRLNNNGELKQWSFDVEDIRTIQVRSSSLRVEAETSPDEHIHVISYITSDTEVNSSVQDGKLSISAESKGKIFSFRMFNFPSCVTIQIPRGYAGNVKLQNENASISAENLVLQGELKTENKNGRISAEDVSAVSITFSNTNGSITIENTNAAELLSATNSNGSITIEESGAKTADFSDSNGRISFEDFQAEFIKVKNSNGSIRFENLFSAHAQIENGNGSIKGSLKGKREQWRVVSNVKNGSSNLTNDVDTTPPYLLEVKNSNGSVKIAFEE